MSKFLKSQSAYWITLVTGISLYFVAGTVEFGTYKGVCLQIEKPWRSIHYSAMVGIEYRGIMKAVEVDLNKPNSISPGDELVLKERIIDFSFDREIGSIDHISDYVLLFGRVNKLEYGLEVPLDQEFSISVFNDGHLKKFSFEGLYYFIRIKRETDYELTFNSSGFNTKRLIIPKIYNLDDSVFSANCLFHKGEDIEVVSLNLDSCAMKLNSHLP